MKLNNYRRKKLGDSWITYVEVQEVELTDCEVNYDASEAEPDVGYPGGLDIESVIHKGIDVLPMLTKAELDNLIERTSEYINSLFEETRY